MIAASVSSQRFDALSRGVEAAAAEDAAIDRATSAGIEMLAQTSATRAAIVQLRDNERALLALRVPSEAPEVVGSIFDFEKATGACEHRKVRAPIGG